MSSKRLAGELTAEMSKATLAILAAGASFGFKKIYLEVNKQLAARQRKVLAKSGGEKEFRKLMYYMDRQDWINTSGRGEKLKLKVTNKGLVRLEKLSFKHLSLPKGQKWDGKWRIVTFDIPESKRRARDALRRLLKELGFSQLHKSVWVTPIPCRRQVLKIKKLYGVRNHISLIEAEYFDRIQEFKQKFKLQIKK